MGDTAALHHEVPHLSLSDLKVICPVGRGAKGVVFLVQNGPFHDFRALKVILRDRIVKKNKDLGKDGDEYKRISFEQQLLNQFDHPLLPKLHGVLATEKIVGYAIDYCPGRDLNSLRKKQTEKMFADDTIRFYAAELVLALEYLHDLGIGYRDLKPENIMIQEDGHIMLVDFDLSKKLQTIRSPETTPMANTVSQHGAASTKRIYPLWRWCGSGISAKDSDHLRRLSPNLVHPDEADSVEKSNSFVGTEEYVAPEVIIGKGHDFAVDWWSLGVVLYEMLYGSTPFRGSNRKETFYRILSKTPELVGEATPLRDLIRNLLEKDPKKRIKVEGVKRHEFFKGLRWDSVVRIGRPPYIPEAAEWEGGREGNEGIDVEAFVEGIFAEKHNKDDAEKNQNPNNGNEANVNNKRVWVDELSDPHQPSKIDDFVVF